MKKLNLNVKKNLKKSLDKKELKLDVWSLVALIPYVFLPTILKLKGWGGFVVAFTSAWLTGAIFDKPSIRRAAWGIAGVHLLYTEGSDFIQNTIKMPLWRIGTYEFAGTDTSTAQQALDAAAKQTAGSLQDYINNVAELKNFGKENTSSLLNDFLPQAEANAKHQKDGLPFQVETFSEGVSY